MNLKEVGTNKKGRGLVVEEEEEEEEEMRKEEGGVQEQLVQAIASITLLLCFALLRFSSTTTKHPNPNLPPQFVI